MELTGFSNGESPVSSFAGAGRMGVPFDVTTQIRRPRKRSWLGLKSLSWTAPGRSSERGFQKRASRGD